MSDAALKSRIQEDMKAAMRAQDKPRLGVIRLILAAIKQVEVDERPATMDDATVMGILVKMLKQRQDSIEQYLAANRVDLADQETFEVGIIKTYMPTPLTEQEIETLLDEAITVVAARSLQDMGKVMAHLKPAIQGRADAGALSVKVKQRLAALS